MIDERIADWENWDKEGKRALEKGSSVRPEKKQAAKQPLSKGTASSSKDAQEPLSKGTSSSSKEGRAGKVCVDWHNTLEVGGSVPAENLEALIQLHEAGYKIIICSWCFVKRDKEVRAGAARLKGPWGNLEVHTTQIRTGPGGKADLAKGWGCTVIFDDAADICEECVNEGLLTYPINSKYEKHQWAIQEDRDRYDSFAQAVENFLLL